MSLQASWRAEGIGQSENNVFWLSGHPVPAGSLGANRSLFHSTGQTVLDPRSQFIRTHLPSPPPGSAHLVLSLVSRVPASTLLPISEGTEGSSKSRVLLCHLPGHFPAPAHDPFPRAYSGKGLADID